MTRTRISIALIWIAIVTAAAPLMAGGGHDHGHGHGHHGEHAEDESKGPHGGRLLVEDDFTVEIAIFEQDVPPQFRIYPYEDGDPISPKDLKVRLTLTRFGNKKEVFEFHPEGEYLTSPGTVEEPHSFDVSVEAVHRGRKYHWEYQSHEGRTELSPSALEVADLSIETAGPAQIANVADVYGRLIPNQDRVAHIRPRFSGIIKEIRKELGDRVKAGEVVAVVESNQSLQPYEIRSYISGEVVSRHGTAGEFVSDDEEILVIANLEEVWADFQVYRSDFEQIERGRSIRVDLGGGRKIEAKVHYVSPITDEATQSKLVRAVIPNPDGSLRPGTFISGTLESAYVSVPLAVRTSALQTFRDWEVVYVTDGRVFQAMPVQTGRRDNEYVEIRSGIAIGDRYVAKNSFIIKADVEKSGASHDH
ncbi:MAG: efflux RND transporter periplasmic adaptor subunit [Bdellovibrionota bacterium]|nr:MAG: efflux RND transporter periplasmic adaptor subunit [Bdellovibrionota bacterium]